MLNIKPPNLKAYSRCNFLSLLCKRMIIVFDAKRAFNNRRGLGNYSRSVIRILGTLYPDNRYLLYTPKTEPNINFEIPATAKIITPQNVCWRKMSALWRTFAISKEAARDKVSVFHGLSHELPVGIERTAVKSVVTMHDLIFLKYPKLYPWIDRKLYKTKYLHSCRIADTIVAVSEQTKRDLIDLAGVPEEKISVVYQGCDPLFYVKKCSEEVDLVRKKYSLPSHYILNVGAIEERKNQKLLIEAASCAHIDMPIVIVGVETGYASTLQSIIRHHHFERRVIILSGISSNELSCIYQAASLFVYPSLFEGFGIPIIEAMASGVPVIAASGSCLEESGGHGSIYVSPTNSEELAVQMECVLGDSNLQERMVSLGTEHLARFSDKSIADALMEVYR